MLNQDSKSREKSYEYGGSSREARSEADWRKILRSYNVTSVWGLRLAWDAITDAKNREKIDRAYRMGKACARMSILVQRAVMPTDLLDAAAYRNHFWEYIRHQYSEKLEVQPANSVGDIDLLIDKVLVINFECELQGPLVKERAELYRRLAENWMVWVLAFRTNPTAISILEQRVAYRKTDNPIFIVPFLCS